MLPLRITPAAVTPEAPSVDDDLAVVARDRCTWCGWAERRRYPRPRQDAPWPSPDWLRCERCGFWNSADPLGGDSLVTNDPYVYVKSYAQRLNHKLRTADYRFRVLEAMTPVGLFLDIGSSYGSMLLAGQQRGWRTMGVDTSAEVVAFAQQHGLDAHEGSLTSVPAADHTFDVVHARHVIEHDVNTYRALREMQRVGKPGALVMIETPDAASRAHGGDPARHAGHGYHWTAWHRVLFTPEVLAGFCARLGWQQVTEPKRVSGPPHFWLWRTNKLWGERTRRASRVVTWWRLPAEASDD